MNGRERRETGFLCSVRTNHGIQSINATRDSRTFALFAGHFLRGNEGSAAMDSLSSLYSSLFQIQVSSMSARARSNKTEGSRASGKLLTFGHRSDTIRLYPQTKVGPCPYRDSIRSLSSPSQAPSLGLPPCALRMLDGVARFLQHVARLMQHVAPILQHNATCETNRGERDCENSLDR